MSHALQDAAEEQQALDWSLGYTSFDCPVCGQDAMLVTERNQPRGGALELEGYEAHNVTPDDVMLPIGIGDVYYHQTE